VRRTDHLAEQTCIGIITHVPVERVCLTTRRVKQQLSALSRRVSFNYIIRSTYMPHHFWLLLFVLISLNDPSSSEPMKPIPRESPLDVAHYPIAPSGLTLEQVHVYVRHGMDAIYGILSQRGMTSRLHMCRRANSRSNTTQHASREYSGTLDVVFKRKGVSCCSIRAWTG
jgi:hypothetical protein